MNSDRRKGRDEGGLEASKAAEMKDEKEGKKAKEVGRKKFSLYTWMSVTLLSHNSSFLSRVYQSLGRCASITHSEMAGRSSFDRPLLLPYNDQATEITCSVVTAILVCFASLNEASTMTSLEVSDEAGPNFGALYSRYPSPLPRTLRSGF